MSDMSMNQALGEIKKFAKFTRAFEKLTEVAGQLERADNILAERGKALGAINDKITKAEASLQEQGTEILARRDELKDIEATAQAERDEIISQANGRAATIVSEARADLDRFTEEGQAAIIDLRELRTEITKKQNGLDALTLKLEKAQQQARRIIEGGA